MSSHPPYTAQCAKLTNIHQGQKGYLIFLVQLIQLCKKTGWCKEWQCYLKFHSWLKITKNSRIHYHSLLIFFQSWFHEFFDSCDGFFARFWLPNNGWVRWSSRLQGISSPSRYGCYVKGSMTPALMDDNFPESWPLCLSLRALGWRFFCDRLTSEKFQFNSPQTTWVKLLPI